MKNESRQTKEGDASAVDELPYEQLVDELDGVVRQLEAGELTLEDSLRAFERGVHLAQAAERRLDTAEQRVEVLLQGDRTQPLAPAASDAERPARGGAPKFGDDDIPF